MFYKLNFPCEVPELSWWEKTVIPTFRTVDVIGIQIKNVDSIQYENDKGQTINTARSTGTDKENASGIKNSFLVEGIDPAFLPPVCLKTGELIDGFTRHSVLLDLGQQKFAYLVVELRSGFSIEDAKDELGLGLNKHPQSKKATINDFKKRLRMYIMRCEQSGKVITKNDGIEWFNNIEHSFTDKQVEDACSDVLNDMRALETMESFSKKEAEKKGAALIGKDVSEVIAVNNGNKTYLERAILDVLDEFGKTGTVPSLVGFLQKTESEHAENERKEMIKKIKSYNRIFQQLMVEYKRDEEFDLLQFEGFIPQIIDMEDSIVQV